MARILPYKITVKPKLRPCIVHGKMKALFHRWEQYSEIIPPSMIKGGHSGGVVSGVMGIVELQGGAVNKCFPEEIQFVDNPFEGPQGNCLSGV